MKTEETELASQIDALNYGVEKSIRYHQRRRAFCDGSHNLIMFGIIISGSAAFAGLADWSGAVATALAAFDFVWKPSHRAKDHELLFWRFSDLAIDVRTGDENEENYAQWEKTRIMIEKDEPPTYCALEADCDNEVRQAWDRDQKWVRIGLWSWLTMNLFRHANTHFQESKSSA